MLLSFERPTLRLTRRSASQYGSLVGRSLRDASRRYLENCTAVEVVFSNDGES